MTTYICRFSNRISDINARIDALSVCNPYADYRGYLYGFIQLIQTPSGLRYIVKVGITDDLKRRMGQYKRCGGQRIWLFAYYSPTVKWIGECFQLVALILTVFKRDSCISNFGLTAPKCRRFCALVVGIGTVNFSGRTRSQMDLTEWL